MIYIVAFGGGLKCPRKIHLNAQCSGPWIAQRSILIRSCLLHIYSPVDVLKSMKNKLDLIIPN